MQTYNKDKRVNSIYIRFSLILFVTIFVLLNTACTIKPDSVVKKPLTAKPEPRPRPLASSGSIYQAKSFKPLFEDRRAHNVGDILTINITENTTASKTGEGDSSRTSSINASSSSFPKFPKLPLTSESKSANQNNANASASNNFSGSVTVTVIDVMENGNLEVSGEKQIAFDTGAEYVRFSGIVNPDLIQSGNFIPSTQVADAKIEYRTGTHLDAAIIATFLQRFFLTFLPL